MTNKKTGPQIVTQQPERPKQSGITSTALQRLADYFDPDSEVGATAKAVIREYWRLKEKEDQEQVLLLSPEYQHFDAEEDEHNIDALEAFATVESLPPGYFFEVTGTVRRFLLERKTVVETKEA